MDLTKAANLQWMSKYDTVSKPVLVAHNGHNFDHQVLFKELTRRGMTEELEWFKAQRFADTRDILNEVGCESECRKLSCLGRFYNQERKGR